MRIFSSCVLVTIFAILAPSFATPTPNPQDVDVCAGIVDVEVGQPINTIDSPFRIRIIPTTAQTPSFNLDYVRTGDIFTLALKDGPGLEFNLNNSILSTPDPRFEQSGLRFVSTSGGELVLSRAEDVTFRQVRRCVGNTPVYILERFGTVFGRAFVVSFGVNSIKPGVFVNNYGQGRGSSFVRAGSTLANIFQVPAGLTEVLLEVVPT